MKLELLARGVEIKEKLAQLIEYRDKLSKNIDNPLDWKLILMSNEVNYPFKLEGNYSPDNIKECIDAYIKMIDIRIEELKSEIVKYKL